MNKYVWELYLKSGGQEVVDFFEDNLVNGLNEEYIEKINAFQKVYCVSEDIIRWTSEELREYVSINKEIKEDFIIEEDSDEQLDDVSEHLNAIEEAIINLWTEYSKNGKNDKEVFEDFIYEIEYRTTHLAFIYYDCMIPYYFMCNYNVLERIANDLDIELPKIPVKKDYKARFFHYGELCKALYKYRMKNEWSQFELLAFLYDFAPKYIGGIDSYIIKDLPEPKSAFFIGGGGDNDDATAEDNPDEITCWQCNSETRAGDMIVMYLRTPISSISSIWRSCSVGFNDPFFFYYRCTYIGHPVKGKRMGIKQIKKDRVLSKMPIVKGNMQGINGVELKPSDYNYIVDKIKAKVTKLEYEEISIDNDYENEKDVEERIIKPFLKDDLGYNVNDYVQQLNVPIGNHNNTLIPDFVLLPRTYGGRHIAYAVVEAKKSIKNEKELLEALDQVSSYALLLSAKHAAVASQEGIWITSEDSRYTDVILSYKWCELNADNDKMYEVKKIIGKI